MLGEIESVRSLAAVDVMTVVRPSSMRLFTMSTWTKSARIIFVLAFAVLLASASTYLRFRVMSVTSLSYPNYETSAWSPFVQIFREISWFGYALSLVLVNISVRRWIE